MKKINIAIVGLGQRGKGILLNVLLKMDEYNVVGLCDTYYDRSVEFINDVKNKTNKEPFTATDYKELLKINNLDAVFISCSWEEHAKVAIYFLKNKISVALEVGCSYDTNELKELVRVEEETRTPFMFMENCCFDKYESMALKMSRDGLFGNIVHMTGAYGHDLREEVSSGNIIRHYRLRNYINRNCENYPTHEIGPIAKILKINRGNRFVSLVSVGSKSLGLKEYINDHKEKYSELLNTDFKQSDIVSTIITCENGETISITLDTTLPRFYARNFSIHGTKALYEANTNSIYFDGGVEEYGTTRYYKNHIDNAKEYEDKYLPDFWKNITKEQLESGHGGMDYFEFKYFADCLNNNIEPLIDVYDAATWMEISVLSEQSIKENGKPMYFTDFTNGKYKTRENKDLY